MTSLSSQEIIDSIDIFAEVERYARGDAQDPLDPHAVYREALAAHPIFQGDIQTELLGLAATPISKHDGPQFTVLGYAEADEALRRSQLFSSTILEESVGRLWGRNILMMDDPEHRAHRLLVQGAFTRPVMDEWRTSFVEPLVDRSIDAFVDLGRVELVSGFASTFPVTVIHAILGLPPEQLPELHKLAAGLLLGVNHPTVAMACAERLGELAQELVRSRRREPRDDLVSVLANERLRTGEMLTDAEIASFLCLLLPAGAETTTRMLSSMMVRLLSEPGLLHDVRGDLGLLDAVANETLRLHPPFQYAYRVCTGDTTLGGVAIPKGAAVSVCIAAANRDPLRFPDPDRFDVTRAPANLAFGIGVHACLGIHLARMEADTATRGFLERLPGLSIDPTMPPPRSGGTRLASPEAVHLRW